MVTDLGTSKGAIIPILTAVRLQFARPAKPEDLFDFFVKAVHTRYGAAVGILAVAGLIGWIAQEVLRAERKTRIKAVVDTSDRKRFSRFFVCFVFWHDGSPMLFAGVRKFGWLARRGWDSTPLRWCRLSQQGGRSVRYKAGEAPARPDRFLVAPGLQSLPRSAAICNPVSRKLATSMQATNNRSKFNVALGVESQGFCLLAR